MVFGEPYETGKCSENSDSLYNRQKILEQLAETLNISVFGTKKDGFVFDVKDERPGRFMYWFNVKRSIANFQ